MGGFVELQQQRCNVNASVEQISSLPRCRLATPPVKTLADFAYVAYYMSHAARLKPIAFCANTGAFP